MSMSFNPIKDSAARRAPRRPTKVFKGHTEMVESIAYFPDGQHIATASRDKTAIIWDVESGRQNGQPLRHDSIVRWIAISPDGRRIASGLEKGGLVVWDVLTREVVHEIKGGGVLRLAYSPDGRWIATALMNDEKVELWDADSGRPGRELLKCNGEVLCVAFSPDGSRVAVGLEYGSFQVIDVSTGESVVGPIKGHTEDVASVVYSPDGRLLVTGSEDGSIRVWDSKSGIQVGKPMLGHENYVTCLSITTDGRRIATAGIDDTVRVWDLETRLQVGDSIDAHGWPTSVAFSPDDRHIVNGGDNVCLWDTESLAIRGSSSPPTTSKKNSPVRARARSVTSSILDLPAVPEPVIPHQHDSSPPEPERSRGSSFDSILDLPAGGEPGNRRPNKKRPHSTESGRPPLQNPAREQEKSKWLRNIRERWRRIYPRKSHVPADIPQHIPLHEQPTVPASPGRGPATDPSAIPMQGDHAGDEAHTAGNPHAQKQPLMRFWNRLHRSGAPSVGSGPRGQKQPTPGVVDVAAGRDKPRLMMSPDNEQYGAPPESQGLPPIASRPPSFFEIEEVPGWSWRRELRELICSYWCFPRNTRPV